MGWYDVGVIWVRRGEMAWCGVRWVGIMWDEASCCCLLEFNVSLSQ